VISSQSKQGVPQVLRALFKIIDTAKEETRETV
jgi:hypothetical protein